MSVHSCCIVFALIYLLSVVDISSAECVPVFMLGNIKYHELISPLKKVNQESFTSILENQLDKKTPVVVFSEETLSPEDFLLQKAQGDSLFSTLSQLKTHTSVNYWSCVKNPMNAITDLKERNIVKVTVESLLSKDLNSGDIYIVDLNDANEEDNRAEMLARHDSIVGKVYSHLAKLKQSADVAMLFTAYRPSWILPEELRSHRRTRDTSKAEPEPPTSNTTKYVVYKNDDVLISAVANPILMSNGTTVSLESFTPTTVNKTEEALYVELKSTTITDVSLTFKFDFAGGYWLLNNITVSNTSAPEKEQNYYFRIKEVYAPERFSYHCTSKTYFYPHNSLQNLTFTELQLQPFINATTGDEHRFGDAYDCVGFMSAPIWSGLFVTFILVLIMTCGLTMMMDIKTMDRFDDPKGKTITITASE